VAVSKASGVTAVEVLPAFSKWSPPRMKLVVDMWFILRYFYLWEGDL